MWTIAVSYSASGSTASGDIGKLEGLHFAPTVEYAAILKKGVLHDGNGQGICYHPDL